MRPPCLLLLIAACGPSLPGDDDSGTITGDLTTTTAAPTSAPPDPTAPPNPTGDPPDPTTGATSTTGETPTTGDGDTDTPVAPLQIVPVVTLPFESGLAGVPLWVAPAGLDCEGPSPMTCGTEPELGEGRLLIDGVLSEASTAPLGARVGVLFPFKGCELGCGDYELFGSTPVTEIQGSNVLPAGLPCTTAEENVWLAFDLGVVSEPGDWLTRLKVRNRCGEWANERTATFTSP